MDSTLDTSDEPSPIGRALHRMATYLVAIAIGVAATLAWQSHGDAAKRMMADWAREQGWEQAAKILSPRTENAVAQPTTPAQGSAPQTPPAQAAAATPVAPSSPAPEVQQLEAMAHDLAAVRQNVEQLTADQKQLAADQKQMAADQRQLVTDQKQLAADQNQMAAEQKQLTAGQEQMAREITKLQTAEQEIQDKVSTAAPRADAPGRRPGPTSGQPRSPRSIPQ
jgi:hypothetical protein